MAFLTKASSHFVLNVPPWNGIIRVADEDGIGSTSGSQLPRQHSLTRWDSSARVVPRTPPSTCETNAVRNSMESSSSEPSSDFNNCNRVSLQGFILDHVIRRFQPHTNSSLHRPAPRPPARGAEGLRWGGGLSLVTRGAFDAFCCCCSCRRWRKCADSCISIAVCQRWIYSSVACDAMPLVYPSRAGSLRASKCFPPYPCSR